MISSKEQPITINIVQGTYGAEFDSSDLQIAAGEGTIWVNQTESPQVILPDNEITRRVMTLAPKGQCECIPHKEPLHLRERFAGGYSQTVSLTSRSRQWLGMVMSDV
jgi:hypothetical protein